MKKTNLIIVTKISEASLANDIKREIIFFLGKRMILDTLDGYPGLIINGILSEEDKSTVTNIVADVSDDTTLLLIESSENEEFGTNKYLVTINNVKE